MNTYGISKIYGLCRTDSSITSRRARHSFFKLFFPSIKQIYRTVKTIPIKPTSCRSTGQEQCPPNTPLKYPSPNKCFNVSRPNSEYVCSRITFTPRKSSCVNFINILPKAILMIPLLLKSIKMTATADKASITHRLFTVFIVICQGSFTITKYIPMIIKKAVDNVHIPAAKRS